MSSGVAQKCPTGPEDLCNTLAKKIEENVNRVRETPGSGTQGLKARFSDQIAGENGPPGSGVGDPQVWDNHDAEIKKQQQRLRDLLNDFNKNNCGDKVPIPSDAWVWATKPAPKGSEWKGPATAQRMTTPATDSGFMQKMHELSGLTGVALVTFAATYFIVSEGSRIVFPIRNLAPVL